MKAWLGSMALGFWLATAATGQSIPTDEAHRADVDLPQLASFLTQWSAGRQRNGTTTYRTERHDGFIRVRYSLYDPKHWNLIDIYYDPERIACFAKDDLLLCYTQIGFRKVGWPSPADSINAKPFQFQQNEITMRDTGDGVYRVIRKCSLGRCNDYE